MDKTIKRIQDRDDHGKSSFKGTKDKESNKIASKIRKFANGFRIPGDMKGIKLSKCPKCSSNMIHHPSLLSMHMSSLSYTSGNARKINIEDQDANFVFKFRSCKKCGYSEFYLYNSGASVRV